MDSLTDHKIQQTIRTEFADCTILTIAHRLETIADADLILVMDDGRIADMGSPLSLLEEPAGSPSAPGLFANMVQELGGRRSEEFVAAVRRGAARSD